jgi:hypothetical protein
MDSVRVITTPQRRQILPQWDTGHGGSCQRQLPLNRLTRVKSPDQGQRWTSAGTMRRNACGTTNRMALNLAAWPLGMF